MKESTRTRKSFMFGSHEWLKKRDTFPKRVPSTFVRSIAPLDGLFIVKALVVSQIRFDGGLWRGRAQELANYEKVVQPRPIILVCPPSVGFVRADQLTSVLADKLTCRNASALYQSAGGEKSHLA